jgi:hypothetical protein
MQTRIVVSFIHGPDAKAHCLGPRDAHQRPLLVVDDGQGLGQRVFIDPLVEYPSEIVTEDHVRFARELVEATQQYLAEMERAWQHDLLAAFDDNPDDEDNPETDEAIMDLCPICGGDHFDWFPCHDESRGMLSREGGEQTTGTAA